MLKTVSLSWSDLGRRTWGEALDDDVPGLAAQLAYYFFLALFPAVLFLLALASFFPWGNVTDDVGRSLGPFVSPQVLELIQEQMRRLANNDNGGLLTFGVAAALWSSSAALVSIVGALMDETRVEVRQDPSTTCGRSHRDWRRIGTRRPSGPRLRCRRPTRGDSNGQEESAASAKNAPGQRRSVI